ncbi:DUF2357 domain-containing protein [Spirochaeta dissipatitropha]
MNSEVLECGPVKIRSSKVAQRRQEALQNDVPLEHAMYKLRGIFDTHITISSESAKKQHVALRSVEGTEAVLASTNTAQAWFFDQTPYMCTVHIPDAVVAYLFTPVTELADSADWDPETKRLTIPLNFGSDLGEFELCWEWLTEDGVRHSASFGSQVFSTKLDIYNDFQKMLEDVGDRFNWIRLDLLRSTSWAWNHSDTAVADTQTWLVVFQEVRSAMEQRLWKLVKQHRRRLVSHSYSVQAERIRRCTPKLEEQIAENLHSRPNRRYRVERKVLDADTPENRYMKHILLQTLEALREVIDLIEPMPRIADIFKTRLRDWATEWSVLSQHRFWRSIGLYRGMRRESLVLSQDPVYAGIRRSWFLLQYGLELLDGELRGGIQNAAQLYEVWCLVKLDEFIQAAGWKCDDRRGFSFDSNRLDPLQTSEELRSGSQQFTYTHPAYKGSELSLLFQPRADATPARKFWKGVMSVPVVQQPDIVIRLQRNDLPGSPVYTWLFDAKYRINENQAPDDTVNQMHRYRDAILWSSPGLNQQDLSRESIGGYVLYPGKEAELSLKSRQIDSIKHSNIGAFPLHPGTDSAEKLETHLHDSLTRFSLHPEADILRNMQNVPPIRQQKNSIIAELQINQDHPLYQDQSKDDWPYLCLPLSLLSSFQQSANAVFDNWHSISPYLGAASYPILKTMILSAAEVEALYTSNKRQPTFLATYRDQHYAVFILGRPYEDKAGEQTKQSEENQIVRISPE